MLLLRGDLEEVAAYLADLSELENPPLTAKHWMREFPKRYPAQRWVEEDKADDLDWGLFGDANDRCGELCVLVVSHNMFTYL
ncbi:hypothetical protein DAI22_03g279200 [Oryza sativa Japonica Group]|jgi:hypothetical protein|nr:hypothetical protein DAI22_03g279200 [Oryza sativa Japonica Group]